MRSVQYIPRATEKAYVAQSKNQYIFFVPQTASKQEIAKRIGEEFKVTVIDVRVTTRKGKQTKYSKGKHAYPGITYRRDHKVAYITLKDGDKIPVFEDQSKAEEDKKATKATEKKSETKSKTTKAAKASEDSKAKKTTAKKTTKAEKETK